MIFLVGNGIIVNIADFNILKIREIHKDHFGEKFLFDTPDNLLIESILCSGTLRVSSQIGCRMGCTFCDTGRIGLLRNITAEEIVGQVYFVKEEQKLSFEKISFIAMGEPFDNYDNVIKAIRIIIDPEGFAFDAKNITISTCGEVSGIQRLMKEHDLPVQLEVSINAPNDDVRSKLMPINENYNMATLRDAIEKYCTCTGRRVGVSYVMIDGVNNSFEDSKMLISYLKGLNVEIHPIFYYHSK